MVKLFGMWDVTLPAWMDNQYGHFGLLLVFWLVIGLLVVLVVRPVIKRLTSKTKSDIDDKILAIIDTPIVVFIFFYGFVRSLDVLTDMPQWFHDIHDEVMTLYGLVVAVFVIYIAYKVFKAVFMPLGMEYAKKTGSELDDVLIPLLDKLGGVLIIVFGLFSILAMLGINITVFLAGAGIIGIVLAFALQTTLGNFFAGIHLMIDRPIKPGDVILIGDDYCRVERIGLRSTRFYDMFTHVIVIMPNNTVSEMKLINLSEPDKKLKATITVGVAHGSSLDKVEQLMAEAVRAQKGVIVDDPARAPVVRFEDFGESALKFTIYYWVLDFNDQWRIAHDARKHMDRAFKEAGIEIPFPQQVVHLVHDQPVGAAPDAKPLGKVSVVTTGPR
jgi:small-conductance mechanosensitive channel